MRPSLVVLHYTAMNNCADALDRLCDPQHEVSAHWLISETGEIFSLVDEDMRAWHAGAGSWAGISDINSHSLGIELANRGDHPFPEPQMQRLETLLAQIMTRWAIAAHQIIGHSDMAPTRKKDPGVRFDWRRLALQGLSIWPQSEGDPSHALANSLAKIGYGEPHSQATLDAFRLRFRPSAKGPETALDRAIAHDLAQNIPQSA